MDFAAPPLLIHAQEFRVIKVKYQNSIQSSPLTNAAANTSDEKERDNWDIMLFYELLAFVYSNCVYLMLHLHLINCSFEEMDAVLYLFLCV